MTDAIVFKRSARRRERLDHDPVRDRHFHESFPRRDIAGFFAKAHDRLAHRAVLIDSEQGDATDEFAIQIRGDMNIPSFFRQLSGGKIQSERNAQDAAAKRHQVAIPAGIVFTTCMNSPYGKPRGQRLIQSRSDEAKAIVPQLVVGVAMEEGETALRRQRPTGSNPVGRATCNILKLLSSHSSPQ